MATIRECDMCGCAIKPFGKVDFRIRKCRWEARRRVEGTVNDRPIC